MRFRFWGVRGSIASPGPRTVRYGGNTTCIEVRTNQNALLILDAGSGIYPLGESLRGPESVEAHLLITHSHWDHINGLPMFE
ncbi:MAG: MBL fold metallo-hydrolase, partial [Betaproteobacteria bacterium]|nr:MBL fold metallo-hydrolase [Betaproteobacteria bacterium]